MAEVNFATSPSASFVHLHVHSHYSLLESSLKIGKILSFAKTYHMPAVALTDHGNMFGAVDFYLAAKAEGIKPILGCEVLYTTGSRFHKPEKKSKRTIVGEHADDSLRLFNLVLLVQNAQGYGNLCEIVTRAYTEGFLHKPRADRELLEKYSEGLIALTAGLKGELPYYFSSGKPEKAEEAAQWFQKIYKENLFFELQENGLPEQHRANIALAELGDKMSVGVVATSEAHYLNAEQAPSQEVLMCISSGRNLSEMSALGCRDFYLKTPEEMQAQFAWRPDACSNTLLIAEKCNFSFKLKDEKGRPIYHLPQFMPEGKTAEETKHFSVEKYIREAAEQGLKERFQEYQFIKIKKQPSWPEKEKQYWTRLKEELDMIVNTGFAGYFLIVSDFICYAKSQGIPVGPGRGSGAGSLVAYALKITDIDPIPFNLLFERFINPERISMPDFDVDFCQDRRAEVIDYVIRKYGKDNVSQIITFGKLLARSVVRDVGRVLGMAYSDVDILAKLVPEELGITLEEAFEKEPRLKEVCEKDPRAQKLFDIAKTLEGVNRNAGIHAAGVVITNRPLVEYGPLCTGKENETVVQYDKDYAEKIGLIKFDFLGLKTLTVIDNAIGFVRKGPNPDFKIEELDYEDTATFQLITEGDTSGVFQLESSGMKDLCTRVMPTTLEDITSINALYRPGPLESGMVDDFINRKHGRITIEYPLPQLEPILNETYGVIVYQEQVMRVARELAGFTLGEADILRRAMGKKKPEEMAKQKDKFVNGCMARHIPQEKADFIFELLSKFAAYGFNKSHSAAYAVLSYQTAYLKKHYPAQFMAALMATEMSDTEKMATYIADAKARGIEVLPPDVNESAQTFSVQGNAIRFGLEAIKGVGGVAVEAIVRERAEKGSFKTFVDFCKRVTLRKVNKKVLESLIQVGAFDRIAEENRATLFESVEPVMKHAASVQEQADLGQVSMFDDYKSSNLTFEENMDHLFQRVTDWPENKKLQVEKALVGFYVSGHPLDKYASALSNFIHGDLDWVKSDFEARKLTFKPRPQQLDEFGRPVWDRSARDYGKYEIITAAVVSSQREILTKKGSRMAFCEFEDLKTKIEGILFPESFEQNGALLQRSLHECLPVVVTAQVDLTEEAPKLFVRSLSLIEDFQSKKIKNVILKLNPAKVTKLELTQLRQILMKHKGSCGIFLEYSGNLEGAGFYTRHSLPAELFVNPTSDMVSEVNHLFKGDVVKFI